MRAKTLYATTGETIAVSNQWAAETEKRGTTVSSSTWTYSGAGTLTGGALTVLNLASPTGLAVANPDAPTSPIGSITGGTTCSYRVVAVNGSVKSAPCVAASQLVGGFHAVVLTWDAVTLASSYEVYGRTAGAELLLATVTGTTYTDTGADTPAGAQPVVAEVTQAEVTLTPTSCGTLSNTVALANGETLIRSRSVVLD